MLRCLAASVLLAGLLAGCASFTVTDAAPLQSSQLSPAGSLQISRDGYRLEDMPVHADAPDLLVVVAMSGGGKRSAAFSYGALKGMRQEMVPTRAGPRPLLGLLDGITGVSGGSFTAAYYGLYRDQMFGRYEKDFLYQDTNSYIFGVYLLPWNWTWLVDPTVGTNDFMERIYDRTLFHGATYRDLQARGRPMIAVTATDIAYGTPFAFIQPFFDVICSDLNQFPVARAVAASNGFPGLFSPVTLTSHRADCGNRIPGWRSRVTQAELRDPLSRLGMQAHNIDRYLDPQQTKYVHLADGGLSDNLGLRVAGGMMLNLAQSAAGMQAADLDRVRRLLVISVDGEGAQDTSVARRKAVGGIFSLFGLVSGNQIDRYNFDTIITVSDQLKELETALRRVRCAEAPTIDGAPCGDVQAAFVHVSLLEMPAGPEKQKLLAIPTGLTIDPPDVDRLVAAGQSAVLNSAPLRQFLDSYPVAMPEPAPPRAARMAFRDAPGSAPGSPTARPR